MTVNPFERTVCSCEACVECCTRQPGPLAPHDVEPILKHLGAGGEALLVASAGATVAKDGKTFRIPTITPARDHATGWCVFLTPEKRCSIHELAPFGCAFFDVHMAYDEAMPRAKWYLTEILKHPEYWELRSKLAEARP